MYAQSAEEKQLLKDLFPLLIETSLLGARFGMESEFNAIINSIEPFRPGHSSLKLARTMALIYLGRPQAAITMLTEDILKDNPGDAIANAYLGLAMQLAGQTEESKAVLAPVSQNTRELEAAELARALLKNEQDEKQELNDKPGMSFPMV